MKGCVKGCRGLRIREREDFGAKNPTVRKPRVGEKKNTVWEVEKKGGGGVTKGGGEKPGLDKGSK